MKPCTHDRSGANQNRRVDPLSCRGNSSEMSPMTELDRLLAVSAFPEWHLQIERGNERTNPRTHSTPKFSSSEANFCSGMEVEREREERDWRVRSSNRWRGGGCGRDAMTKMMSSFLGFVRPMAKSGHTTLEPFRSSLSLSLSLSLLPPMPPMPLPLSGHPSEASDNDNVAFGIPTDLETSLALERGGRESVRRSAAQRRCLGRRRRSRGEPIPQES